jgi:hypothetical protein
VKWLGRLVGLARVPDRGRPSVAQARSASCRSGQEDSASGSALRSASTVTRTTTTRAIERLLCRGRGWIRAGCVAEPGQSERQGLVPLTSAEGTRAEEPEAGSGCSRAPERQARARLATRAKIARMLGAKLRSEPEGERRT